jgi:hypothetical protein
VLSLTSHSLFPGDREADVKDAEPLLQLMRTSLFCNNEDHLQFYLKWLATLLQAVESGRIADIKTRVDILLKGPQGNTPEREPCAGGADEEGGRVWLLAKIFRSWR